MEGQYCRVEPVDPQRHAAQLHDANMRDTEGRMWSYLPYGPFGNAAEYRTWLVDTCLHDDPLFHAVIDGETDKAVGLASYLRITPAVGVIEVGHIAYSPQLQRTKASTEAMYLMMQRVFDELGYRRYEWKCDALNAASRNAALRLGFEFEGIFRQATIYKGRNRDTAWLSITDREWPGLKSAFLEWLSPGNFDDAGQQRTRLGDLTAKARLSFQAKE